MNTSVLIILSGPSGAGKTTIAQELLIKLKDLFSIKKIVTYTTRQPRGNEKNGKDYHFIDKKEFEQKIEEGFFFEYTTYNHEYYGTPKHFEQHLAKGISCLAVTDYTVAQHIKNSYPDTLLFWIQPPSLATLQKRLEARSTEPQERIMQRLAIAKEELALEEKEQYFTFHIVNDDLQVAIETIKEIILYKKEHA